MGFLTKGTAPDSQVMPVLLPMCWLPGKGHCPKGRAPVFLERISNDISANLMNIFTTRVLFIYHNKLNGTFHFWLMDSIPRRSTHEFSARGIVAVGCAYWKPRDGHDLRPVRNDNRSIDTAPNERIVARTSTLTTAQAATLQNTNVSLSRLAS